MNERIKIGILTDNGFIPLWIYRAIEKIINSQFTELKLAIHFNVKDRINSRNSFFFRIHKKIDSLLIRNRIVTSATINVSEELHEIPKIYINTDINKPNSNYKNTFQEIKSRELDIILNFSSFTLNESTIEIAKYGIWSCKIDNKNLSDCISVIYWKLIKKLPVINIVIQSTNNSYGNEIVIYSGWIATNFNSINLNLNHVFGFCSAIMTRLMMELNKNGSDFINSQATKYEKPDDELNTRILSSPSNSRALVNMALVLFRYLYQRLTFQDNLRWFLMYKFDKNPLPDKNDNYKVLNPPKDRFWADPFVVKKFNKIFIFLEEFIYRDNKGHITLLELDKKGELVLSKKLIERKYHMSYPFIFKHDNNYFMIPETSENKTVELYKCDEFPGEWSFVMNLMENIFTVDTTLFFFNNKWWLFTAINETSNFSDHVELFLYSSYNLFTTEWVPHPCNPIITDIRVARPAGRIFLRENKIFRPSQDCSGRYGRAFNLNQITTLTETSYNEVLISKTEANWGPTIKGTHTFNFDENFSIIDAFKLNRRFNF
jgi:hypothetical protein